MRGSILFKATDGFRLREGTVTAHVWTVWRGTKFQPGTGLLAGPVVRLSIGPNSRVRAEDIADAEAAISGDGRIAYPFDLLVCNENECLEVARASKVYMRVERPFSDYLIYMTNLMARSAGLHMLMGSRQLSDMSLSGVEDVAEEHVRVYTGPDHWFGAARVRLYVGVGN